MSRRSDIWFWEARNAWYTQINGKKVKLHADRKEAEREFYRLMAAEGRLDARRKQAMTVADACRAFLDRSHYLRANSMILLERLLGRFADSPFGASRCADVVPEHVVAWIANQDFSDHGRCKGSGDPSRHLMLRFVKALFRWARDAGLCDVNVFARVPNNWKLLPRSRVMSEGEYVAIMSRNRLSDEFREIIEFVWRTGARPGELCVLEARHLDAHMMMARLAPREHKTGGKTGLYREIHFPADLWARLKAYAEIRRAGPLLRRANGKPWTPKAISNLFHQLKTNMGLDCVLYQARHSWATSLLGKGYKPEIVAKMAGHVRPDVLISTYYHPAAEEMQAAAGSTARDHAGQAAAIGAKVEERREEQLRKRKARAARSEAKRRDAGAADLKRSATT